MRNRDLFVSESRIRAIPVGREGRQRKHKVACGEQDTPEARKFC